ncbi:D-alanyl-D-alanine carboxypeptidase family protein [Limosilactobacillus panis]|uniref:Serine hydrolase n=1 Tax=Limosilactobacillus panis TaxID=47493 RepID=A0ABT7VMD4_9LACO|nr:serine hydrolase [Limosilactobacillus panis]MDM8333904.1 serine hydrolase [Limosilactobacillus panis]
MIGRKFIKQLAVFMMIPLILSLATSAGASGRIDASAAMMVDASTGQVLYAQNVNKKLPVASISKLLTVAVIHDELKQNAIMANTKVKVSSDIAAIANDPNYSAIGVQQGASYTVKELLNAAMVKSADGATLALASADGSSMEEFNLRMAQKAKEIGLKNYTIVNPVGLTNGDLKDLKLPQYSDKAENAMTARDVAILSRYLIRTYPQLLQVTAQKQANFFITKNKTVQATNLNKMLPGDQYAVKGVKIDGLKTGTSDAAGASFVSTGTYRGHRIITVVLHANGKNKDARFTATQELYDKLKQMPTSEITLPQRLHTQRVENGHQRTVSVQPRKISVWGDKVGNNYNLAVKLNRHSKNNKVLAPVRNNERIGELELSSPEIQTVDHEPLSYTLYSSEQVPVGNFWQRLWH